MKKVYFFDSNQKLPVENEKKYFSDLKTKLRSGKLKNLYLLV